MCLSVYLHVHLYTRCMSGAHTNQKKVSHPLMQRCRQLQATMQVLGFEPRTSGKAGNTQSLSQLSNPILNFLNNYVCILYGMCVCHSAFVWSEDKLGCLSSSICLKKSLLVLCTYARLAGSQVFKDPTSLSGLQNCRLALLFPSYTYVQESNADAHACLRTFFLDPFFSLFTYLFLFCYRFVYIVQDGLALFILLSQCPVLRLYLCMSQLSLFSPLLFSTSFLFSFLFLFDRVLLCCPDDSGTCWPQTHRDTFLPLPLKYQS